MRALLHDARLALRGFLKEPRFLGIALLTLALGVGSVTTIFSVVNGVLLKPLPYPQADRLVNLWSNAAGLNLTQFPLSPDLYFYFRTEARSFDDITTFLRREANLTEAGDPDVVPVAETTASYFSTFGIAPADGRLYGQAEDQPGAPLVIVLSHRLWQRRFAADPATIGKAVRIDGEPATIIGVLPRALDENGSPDLWMPARLNPAQPPVGTFRWPVSARLRDGVPAAAAEAEFEPLMQRYRDGMGGPDYRAFLTEGRYRVVVHAVREDVIGNVRQPLWILFGTVGFVLLIACANVANLFLIRAEGRQRDVAVRAALGATRGQLIRAHFVEAFVLAALGGALGVALAAVALPALIGAAPAGIPRLSTVGIDLTVLLVATLATALAALIFGVVPAVRGTRPAALGALRQGGRGTTADKSRQVGRRLLVVLQTALTLILLTGSGLLVRSFSRMLDTDLGFDPANVLTFRVAVPSADYPDFERASDFQRRLVERLAALPGVESAGAATQVPMAEGASGTAFVFDGIPTPPGELPPIVRFKRATAGYVETMGMRLIKGRAFDRRDMAGELRDVMVNEALANTFWPGADPIGKRLRPSGSPADAWFTVAGVVSSERHDGLRRDPPALVYYPLTVSTGGADAAGVRAMTFVIRGPNVENQAAAARAAVWAIDPHLPVAVVRTMDEIVSRSIVSFTFTMLTLAIAAGMALVLGTVGLYGVLSYVVTLRVREIGVRLALGAPPARVMRAVVGQGLFIAGIGLVAGLGGAVALTRYLGDLLYDTPPLDAATFAAVSLGLGAIAALASYLPARRAASVSPLESLRLE